MTDAQRAQNRERNRRWREANRARKREQSNAYYARKRAALVALKAIEPRPTTKRCAACKAQKPFAEFGVDRKRKDRRAVYCNACSRKKRDAIDPLKKRAYRRNYYLAHRESVAAKSKALRLKRRAEHPEQVIADGRRWQRERRLRNPSLARARDKERRQRYRPTVLAAIRRWGKTHRDAKNAHEMMRRARKKRVSVEFVDPCVVFERAIGVCGICKKPIDRAEKWHVDHIVPLAMGGEHSYKNTQPAHPLCNLAKGARLIENVA